MPVFAANHHSSTATSHSYPSASPTYVGSASKFISGPYYVTSVFSGPDIAAGVSSPPAGPSPAGSAYLAPELNPRPLVAAGNSLSAGPAAGSVPPTVSCYSTSSGCDSIGGTSAATTNPLSLNAVSSGSQYQYTIEPSDMAFCAGNGYAMQALNIGVVQVYDGSTLQPISGVVSLDALMGLSANPVTGGVNSATGLNMGSGGDVSCLYDQANGGHWFITEFVSNASEPFSPFEPSGCFSGAQDGCLEGIAVSVTNDPMGAYNLYLLNPNHVNHDPGRGYLLNDFTKIGNTNDAFLLFYDEFNLNGNTIPACPSFGCNGFNGAQEFAIDKAALEAGLPVTSPTFNVAYENMGNSPNLYPIGAHAPYQPVSTSCYNGRYAGYVCWYAVIPAQSPDAAQFDNHNGGTGYMVGALDFFGYGDNRLAVFAWTGLSGLDSSGCSRCSRLAFGGQLLTTGITYMNEGATCPASQGGYCGLAAQKAGPVPLGDNCVAAGYDLTVNSSGVCPESGVATNGDFLTQASYADHQIWTAVTTLITQTTGDTSGIHVGAGYWAIGTNSFDHSHKFTITSQAYVTANGQDLSYPSIAGSDTGTALITFTLSGVDYYPSTAYGTLTSTSAGLSDQTIHVSAQGAAPQDGFTQYIYQNRWGDYTQAIFVQGSGFYFSTGTIQYPNCGRITYQSDPTCGGTRTALANWGSSINLLGTS